MKVGDTVRFLNDIGGGVVARIEGRIAYVTDSDGFETPMHVSECVVVPSAAESEKTSKPAAATIAAPATTKEAPKISPTPASQTSNSIALLFEPQEIRRLSQTAFDLYLVNDTSQTLMYSIAAHDRLDSLWTPIASGTCPSGVQDFLGEVFHTELNKFENIAVQIIVLNQDAPFELRAPIALELRFDVTRLAKLHCFTPTDYSSAPVLTIPILSGGKVCHPTRLEALVEDVPIKETPRVNKPKLTPKRSDDPQVVDLHIHELLDSTAGMEPAEMLALQLEVFDKKMAEAAKTPGKKIIFIHGKGEGVLRRAILDRLRRRWPRCEAQDASFREYGFGATQITIRK